MSLPSAFVFDSNPAADSNPTADTNLPAHPVLAAAAYFSVHARAEPGVMPRVMELFAKRGLVPAAWHSTVSAADRRELTIKIAISGLDPDVTDYIAACMRQLPYVETVLTTGAGRMAGDARVAMARQSG
jgi:acetolactate synthase small subunit